MSFTTSAPKSLLGAVFNFGAKSASKALKSAILHTLQAKARPPPIAALLRHIVLISRGGVEGARLEATAKETKKFRGQGQTLSRPRPRPKDTDASVLQKKKLVFKKFFQAIQEKGLQKNFKAKKVFKNFFFQAIFT